MNLQRVSLTPDGLLNVSGSAIDLDSAVTVNGRKVFRRSYGLRISTGGLANRIQFQPGAAHMQVSFEPDQFDIASSAEKTSKGSQALVIELPVPLQIRGARFTGVGSSATVELYRLDGDEFLEDPTKTFANDGLVSGEFIDMRFGVKVRKADATYANIPGSSLADLDVKGFPTAARVGIQRVGVDTPPFFFWIIPGEVGKPDGPSGSNDIGAMLADVLQQEIAGLEAPYPPQLDFKLFFESDAPCQFTVSSFTIPFGLVRASFRGVLLRREDVTDPVALAVHLREAATPLAQYLRSKLAPGTGNAIDRVDRSVPDRTLTLTLNNLNHALQTEAVYSTQRFAGITLTPETLAAAQASPTGVQRTRVNRALLAEAFPDVIAPISEPTDDEKEVLDARGANSTLDVRVDVPRTATLRSARVRLEGDLKGDAPAGGSNGGNGGNAAPEWDQPIPDQDALTVDESRAVARQIVPDVAVDASGIALALAIASRSAELTAEIREDQDGAPAGRTIASATVVVARLDRPEWIHFAFAKPAILQNQPCWIVLRAASGSALWFGSQEPATTRVGNASKGWTDSGGFTHISLLHHIWSRAAAGAALAGSGTADLAGRLRVTIGNAIVSPLPGATGRAREINIATALQQWLALQPGPVAIVSAPIRVSALGKGSVTVYPPEIEYDV